MKHQQQTFQAPRTPIAKDGMPAPLDSETRAMLRLFLAPILEEAWTWNEIADRMQAKGYVVAFRNGHMVVSNDLGVPLCTGRDIGVPLAALSARIGRPCVQVDRDGAAGVLRPANR